MSNDSRVLPHNLDAERSVLGAILIRNDVFAAVTGALKPEAFFRDAHRRIYRHLVALQQGRQPMDLVMLKESLQRTGELDEVGGPVYIASLVDGVPFAVNVEGYARVVQAHAIRRELIALLSRRIDTAYAWDGPASELLEAAAADVASLTPKANATAPAPSDLFVTALETCRDQERAPMLLEPYLPENAIGSIVAKIKTGKTATILEMVRCGRRREGFCGFPKPAVPFRVMYATEQPRASFVNQLHDAGLQEDEGLVVSYLAAWRGRPWVQVAPALIEAAMANCTPLLVLDTGSAWFGFRDDQENQAGAAACVRLLYPFVANGGTVLIPRHGRKSGGSAHDAGRGSSAIDGAVDFILHLSKPSGQSSDVREIEAVGRFEMPESLQIRRRANIQLVNLQEIDAMTKLAPRYVFEAVTVHVETPKGRIRTALSQGAQTAKQLSQRLNVSVATVSRTLEDMASEVVQVGKGGPRNNAAVYGLKAQTTTSSPQSLRGAEVESWIEGPGTA